MDELSRRIEAGPGQFPHQIDLATDRLLFVELTAEQIAAASFLDQRVLTATTKGAWAAIDAVMRHSAAAGADDADYIFHIGHVGSTLISRLLDRVPGVLGLREPLILRAIAEARAKADAPDAPWDPAGIDARTAALRQLLARRFDADQRVIVKATSFTSDIAPALVAPGAKALFVQVRPESYLRTIMAGEASRRELAMLTGPRLIRLARRIGPMRFRPWNLGEGEQAALGWATEMLSLAAAEAALPPGAVLRIDFDDFLSDPAAALMRIATHLALPMTPEAARALARDPVMQRYSKGPEHGYSADLRRQLQLQAGREHGAALRQGLAWLDTLACDHAAVARVMGRID